MKTQHLINYGKSALKKNRESGEKPLEDFIVVDNDKKIFIVCDGVTRSLINGKYPNPSPAAMASTLFAETVHKTLVGLFPINAPKESMIKAIETGNHQIANFNKKTFTEIDYIGNDLAGTIAIVGFINNNTFYYAYNGDCCGYLITENASFRFTNPQTAQVAKYREKFGFGNDATIKIRRDFRNNKQHPLGYGVYTGELSAMDFVEYGEVQLAVGQKVLLASDGISYLLDTAKEVFYKLNPESIISQAEILEDKLSIRSDDKAVIIIETTELI